VKERKWNKSEITLKDLFLKKKKREHYLSTSTRNHPQRLVSETRFRIQKGYLLSISTRNKKRVER